MDEFLVGLRQLRSLQQGKRNRCTGGKKAAPLEVKNPSSTSSSSASALLLAWAAASPPDSRERSCSPSTRRGATDHPPPNSSDHLSQSAESSLPSLYAPCTTELPPLVSDTIGYVARTILPTSALVPSSPSSPLTSRSIAYTPFSCVVVDLETTGLSPYRDEILEVGCVELRWNPPLHARPSVDDLVAAEASTTLSRFPSSPSWVSTDSLPDTLPGQGSGVWSRGPRSFHRYVCPSSRAAMSAAATAVHGITWDKVKFCPTWTSVAEELAVFLHAIAVDNDCAASASSADLNSLSCTELMAVQLPPLVAHNAGFDTTFLETHLRRSGYHVVSDARFPATCTMKWVKRSYPHIACNLDAICRFLRVDGASERAGSLHSALVDATLTASLFLQLCHHWEEKVYALGDAET